MKKFQTVEINFNKNENFIEDSKIVFSKNSEKELFKKIDKTVEKQLKKIFKNVKKVK